MYEELYVIKDGERFQLDLNTPSGITLNFKSNLFGDLSKITCSYTYTFKLPMTVNNRQILDCAEDIRHESGMIRKRLKAEFWLNGVNLFSNANLYISEISKTYSAVLTWNVNDSLENLKNDDISLNELPNPDNVMTTLGSGTTKQASESFNNEADVLYPTYNCGLPYYMFDTLKGGRRGSSGSFNPIFTTGTYAFPLPVVPVYRLLKLIEAHFGIQCQLGKKQGVGEYSETTDEDDIITHGVIPLVGIDLNDTDLESYAATLNGVTCHNMDETFFDLAVKGILSFNNISIKTGPSTESTTDTNAYFSRSRTVLYKDNYALTGTTFENTGVCPKLDNMKFEYDGCITVDITDTIDEVPSLSIYQLQNEYVFTGGGAHGTNGRRNHRVWKELTSIDGEQVSGKTYCFDFAASHGCDRLECSNAQSGQPISFQFNYHTANGVINVPITAHLSNNDACVFSRPISLYSNLPDISCHTFIKSLFYMIGAYPVPNNEGVLIPHYFSTIEENKLNENVLDWSSKDATLPDEQPTSIKFSLSEFAQNNYYLMKSDNLDKTDKDSKDETDVYADGIGCLYVGNEVLEKDKTIIQFPFYAPFMKNKKSPSLDPGDTMKAWENSDEEAPAWIRPGSRKMIKFVTPKPCYGLIYNRARSYIDNGVKHDASAIMSMKVWNGFKEMLTNKSFRYLQSIIATPYVIKIELNLDEFDLRDLDYSVPIYLNKYNSYFAIVSIQRDSKGKCKCELIKLP